MINTQVLKGNLIRQDYTTAFTLSQGDKGVPFKIELLENGTPYTLLSDDTVSIEWYKPNGSPFLQDTGITKGDTYIEITTPEAIAQHDGVGTFNIIISNGDVRKGTIRREYKVIPTSMRPGSASEDVITDAITELRNLNTEIAETLKGGSLSDYAKKVDVETEVNTINASLEEKANKDDVSNSISDVNTKITTTKTELKKLISDTALATKKALYPVNSIYLSLNSTNPNTLFGFGTWELIAQGRTLVGVDTTDTDFNTPGKTGGNKTHAHDSGSLVADIGAVDGNTSSIAYNAVNRARTKYNLGIIGNGINGVDSKDVNHATSVSGNTGNESSLQPYFCVYIFKRTA